MFVLEQVYKGVIADTCEAVTVERVFEKHFRCLDECKSQMELLSGLYHNNLVLYVGFCYTEEETILVFEYLANHTLERWLSGEFEDKGFFCKPMPGFCRQRMF